jgi:hypothetical protein
MAAGKPPGRPKGTPKTGGRKKGTPNKATVEIKTLAQTFVQDAAGQAKLLEQYRDGTIAPGVLQLMLHYAYGKPKDQVEHSGEVGIALSWES